MCVLVVAEDKVSCGGAVKDALKRRKGGEDEKMWMLWWDRKKRVRGGWSGWLRRLQPGLMGESGREEEERREERSREDGGEGCGDAQGGVEC